MHLLRSLPLRRLVLARHLHPSPAWHRSLKHFKLADIGEGITECELIKWNVKPSGAVQEFDPLCEVQSDKASVEITSPFDGILSQILVAEGEVAKVGQSLCVIEVDDDTKFASDNIGSVASGQPASPCTAPPPLPPDNSFAEPPAVSQRRPHPLDPNAVRQDAVQSKPADVLATPSARHYARQSGVDLTALAPGSGKAGRIEKKDIDAYLKGPDDRTNNPPPQGDGDIVVELGRTRKNMWKAMVKSLDIPQFGISTTFDITALHEYMPVLNAHIPRHYLVSSSAAGPTSVISPDTFYSQPLPLLPESAKYTRMSYLPVLLKTLSKAMMEWPLFRSSITPMSSPDLPTLTVRPHADISIALSTPTGLYTPTLQGVDTQSAYALASQLKHISHLGRQVPSALSPAEMPKRGGTVTVSNVGGIGQVDSASPILVPGGGVAIVALGRAKWVWDVERGDGHGERRLKIGVSWSADHRVVEGAELVAFVESWRQWIETPQRFVADS